MILLRFDHIPVSWLAHSGYGRRSFNPKFKERDYVVYHTKQQYTGEPLTGPVSVIYAFHLPIPESTSKVKRQKMLDGEIQHTKRKDVTNMVKFYEDCIKGIAFVDDAQVVEFTARKMYSDEPKVCIMVRGLEELSDVSQQ